MLVCCKEKYFKVLKTFLKEEMFNAKLKFRPTSPINLHFSLVHQENMPYLFYEFTNPQHITKFPRGNICLGVRSKAVVLRPMGKSYRGANQVLSQCKQGLSKGCSGPAVEGTLKKSGK